MKKALRTTAAIVVGYAAMVILITLVQETWLGGVGWHESSLHILALAGFLTMVSAAVGAVTATAIARPSGRIPAFVMSSLIVLETTALVLTGKASGPLWFDLLAASSLIIAILFGAELFLRLTGSTPRQSSAG